MCVRACVRACVCVCVRACVCVCTYKYTRACLCVIDVVYHSKLKYSPANVFPVHKHCHTTPKASSHPSPAAFSQACTLDTLTWRMINMSIETEYLFD